MEIKTPKENKKNNKNNKKYRINLLVEIKKEKIAINSIGQIKINKDEINTINDLKYYIIDKFENKNLCPCKISVSIPFEGGFYCSELNDTPEKNIKDCFDSQDIYIIIDFDGKCDCGFNDLENLSKREIYEKYLKEINKLKKQIELLQCQKDEIIKKYEKLNKDKLDLTSRKFKNLINFDENVEKEETSANIIIPNSEDNDNNNNTIKFIDNKSFLNPIFENFYDVIIDIKSIKDINEGWEIKMNKSGEKRFNKYKNKESLIIGVIGNSNRGKSFLLSKISKIALPTGTSIRTEGLSIKYPELEKYKYRNIILLDTAGLETPLLLEKDNITKEEDTNALNELIKEKARDKLMTELFLQNFIICYSNILISVVGILTYSEQKLLNRIREESIKTKKTLFIIHNLMTFTRIEQVQQYIKNYLLKDATFDLEERTIISTKIGKEKNVPYYYEKNSKIKIFHLIFANEGSEAGDFYNEFALNFFENSYQLITDIEPFDVIQRLKERFIEESKILIEKNENNLWIKDKDFLDNKMILREKRIRLESKREIVLKRCYIDELGISKLRNNGFNPNYNYYEKDNKLIIKIEAPGNIEVISDVKYHDIYTVIEIKGKKNKDKEPEDFEDNIFNSREYGEFIIHIYLMKNIENKEPNIKVMSGIIIIEYNFFEYKNKIYEYKVYNESKNEL